jgi:hypothetical protein
VEARQRVEIASATAHSSRRSRGFMVIWQVEKLRTIWMNEKLRILVVEGS